MFWPVKRLDWGCRAVFHLFLKMSPMPPEEIPTFAANWVSGPDLIPVFTNWMWTTTVMAFAKASGWI